METCTAPSSLPLTKPCNHPTPSADLNIDTIYFSTWFGGGDASWAPQRDTFALFRNMRLFTYDGPGPQRVPPNMRVNQTVITTTIDEPEY